MYACSKSQVLRCSLNSAVSNCFLITAGWQWFATWVLTDISWVTCGSFWFFQTVLVQCLTAPHAFAAWRSLHQYDSPQAHLSKSTAEPTAIAKRLFNRLFNSRQWTPAAVHAVEQWCFMTSNSLWRLNIKRAVANKLAAKLAAQLQVSLTGTALISVTYCQWQYWTFTTHKTWCAKTCIFPSLLD